MRTFRAVARPLPINRTLRPQDITVGVFGRQRERSRELLIGYGAFSIAADLSLRKCSAFNKKSIDVSSVFFFAGSEYYAKYHGIQQTINII